MKRRSPETLSALYLVSYIPNIVVVRAVATGALPFLGRPISGLQMLPPLLLLSGFLTAAFVLGAGWWRAAHRTRLLGRSFPRPTRWTVVAGLGTAMILFAVPVSYTFREVSIPFAQLLMRGSMLFLAPIVDLIGRRRIRWYSWVALGLAATAILVTVVDRQGTALPPLAMAAVAMYVLGSFVRLLAMTRESKTPDPARARGYFVEEKLVGIPAALGVLAVVALSGNGPIAADLLWGFTGVWTAPVLPAVLFLAATLFAVSVFSAFILLGERENAYCVSLERSASILAGTAATFLLAWMFGQAPPTSTELIGVGLVVSAITLLSVAPHFGRDREGPMASDASFAESAAD